MNTKNLYLAVIAIVIFAIRYFFALPEFNEKYAGSYIGQKLTLKGMIIEQPEEGEFYSRFKLKILEIEYLNTKYDVFGFALIQKPLFSGFNYGDVVKLTGTLEKPAREDPRIAVFIRNPDMRVISTDRGDYFLSLLFKLRAFLIGRLNNIFPEPASGFSAGILFGFRNGIPRELLDDFRRAGLTHVLALSGFNIVILIAFVENLFLSFSRKTANVLSLVFIFVFTLMVGASASVVRAAIMGSLTLVAKIFGRKSSGMRSLLIAAFLMILLDPFIIIYDIGFQLSFAATAGLILFTERLKKVFEKCPNWFGMRDSLVSTFSAQIFTTPLIIYYFKGLSIVAPLANLVVLPFIPILMLGSFLGIIFGKIIAVPTWLLFEIVLNIIHIFASLPFSFVEVGIS